jgi:hypothetical protein
MSIVSCPLSRVHCPLSTVHVHFHVHATWTMTLVERSCLLSACFLSCFPTRNPCCFRTGIPPAVPPTVLTAVPPSVLTAVLTSRPSAVPPAHLLLFVLPCLLFGLLSCPLSNLSVVYRSSREAGTIHGL